MQIKSIDPISILTQLTVDEKISLLSGDDSWHVPSIPRLGIPRVRCSDGPNGVRGIKWVGGAPASCTPAATSLGASFDVDLLERVGAFLIGDECIARGVHIILGPTTNIQRNPLGGRGFESYGEDPFLSGTLATAWIEGVHSRKVMVTPKHFVGNEQEFQRRSNNSIIDERSLAEIYLEPFRLQMKTNPSAMMTSYNRVNGTHASENMYLLRKILRNDFGFKGVLMSDWSGTYSSSEAIKAGLDLEMPGPAVMRGASLQRDLTSMKLSLDDIDDCALRMLHIIKEAMDSGIGFELEERSNDTPETRALLLESASSGIVLLKNSTLLLPLSENLKTIAVIGLNAFEEVISGGGSASLKSTYAISPLEGITKVAKEIGAKVSYAIGAHSHKWTPLLNKLLRLPGGKFSDEAEFRMDFYDVDPYAPGNENVKRLWYLEDESSFVFLSGAVPEYVPKQCWILLRAVFIPNETGLWELGLGVAGQGNLYLDNQLIIENSTNQVNGPMFFTSGTEEKFGQIHLEAGRSYELEVRFSNFVQISPTSPYSGGRGGIRIGGYRKGTAEERIAEAVTLAKKSEVTIVVIGTNKEWESEGYDRDDMKLPPGQDALVRALITATPNLVVVNQSGMPVEFPWIEECSTLVQAFFGGNESGSAIANVLFGRFNPSGKLPVTFPRVLEDHPGSKSFGDAVNTVYSEGIMVGYRYFSSPGAPKALFPFGYGLSYSTFKFTNLKLESIGLYGLKVSVDITNTGTKVAGAEVAQIYVHALNSSVVKPEIELKGFAKAFLAPGETSTVSSMLDHTSFSYYNVQLQSWIGEKGAYEIRVGNSSDHISISAPYCIQKSFSWIGLQDPKPIKLI